MKNLLISKSFSYEIVDSTLLWQTNTYHLGGGRSILLSYRNTTSFIQPTIAYANPSGKLMLPCSQMVPLNLLPTCGSPYISIILIDT